MSSAADAPTLHTSSEIEADVATSTTAPTDGHKQSNVTGDEPGPAASSTEAVGKQDAVEVPIKEPLKKPILGLCDTKEALQLVSLIQSILSRSETADEPAISKNGAVIDWQAVAEELKAITDTTNLNARGCQRVWRFVAYNYTAGIDNELEPESEPEVIYETASFNKKAGNISKHKRTNVNIRPRNVIELKDTQRLADVVPVQPSPLLNTKKRKRQQSVSYVAALYSHARHDYTKESEAELSEEDVEPTTQTIQASAANDIKEVPKEAPKAKAKKSVPHTPRPKSEEEEFLNKLGLSKPKRYKSPRDFFVIAYMQKKAPVESRKQALEAAHDEWLLLEDSNRQEFSALAAEDRNRYQSEIDEIEKVAREKLGLSESDELPFSLRKRAKKTADASNAASVSSGHNKRMVISTQAESVPCPLVNGTASVVAQTPEAEQTPSKSESVPSPGALSQASKIKVQPKDKDQSAPKMSKAAKKDDAKKTTPVKAKKMAPNKLKANPLHEKSSPAKKTAKKTSEGKPRYKVVPPPLDKAKPKRAPKKTKPNTTGDEALSQAVANVSQPTLDANSIAADLAVMNQSLQLHLQSAMQSHQVFTPTPPVPLHQVPAFAVNAEGYPVYHSQQHNVLSIPHAAAHLSARTTPYYVPAGMQGHYYPQVTYQNPLDLLSAATNIAENLDSAESNKSAYK